jgi:hypothetical protein
MTQPYNPRIVFAAVVAFTEKITKDGRVLVTPEDFHVRPGSHGYPLPVMWTPPNHGGKPVQSVRVGVIEEAYVIDHRLITFGHIDESEHGRRVAELLDSGQWFLEIDIDSGSMTYDLDPMPAPFEAVPVGPVIFKDWRLRAAWVGTQPCWDLPSVQIQEITR